MSGTDTLNPINANDVLAKLGEIPDGDDKESSSKVSSKESTTEEPTEDIKIDFSGQDDEEEPEEESKEDDSDDELKVELKDESDDEKEYKEIPTRQQLKKYDPELFKKFPGLDKVMFREIEYAKVFPTVATAKDAKQQLEYFDNLKSDLTSGNIENLLVQVKQASPGGYNKLVGSLLDQVFKADQASYVNIVNRVMKTALKKAFEHGEKDTSDPDKQLSLAAKILNKFIYGSHEITDPENFSSKDIEEDPRFQELSKKEEEFNNRQLSNAGNEISTSVERTIKSAVLKYIDPKDSMTDYVKDKAIAEVMDQVKSAFSADSRFVAHMSQLWQSAKKEGYSESSKAAIRQNLIQKAQSVMADIIRDVRSRALKGSNKVKVNRKVDEVHTPSPKPKVERNEQKPKGRTINGVELPSRIGNASDVMSLLNKTLG